MIHNPEELAGARRAFIGQLGYYDQSLALHGAAGYSSYWQMVASAAPRSEDLRQLERWQADLDRDRARLLTERARQQKAAGNQMGDQQLVLLINRLLLLLDDVSRRVKTRYVLLRDMLSRWVFLAGMGVRSKPTPVDTEPDEHDEDAQIREDLQIGSQNKPKRPTKQKSA